MEANVVMSFYEELKEKSENVRALGFRSENEKDHGYYRGIMKSYHSLKEFIENDPNTVVEKFNKVLCSYLKEEKENPINTEFMEGYYKAMNDTHSRFRYTFAESIVANESDYINSQVV